MKIDDVEGAVVVQANGEARTFHCNGTAADHLKIMLHAARREGRKETRREQVLGLALSLSVIAFFLGHSVYSALRDVAEHDAELARLKAEPAIAYQCGPVE
jgi:hypothetical protein